MAIIMTSLINTMSATSPTPASSSSAAASSVSSFRSISHVAVRRGLPEHNISIKLPSKRWNYRSKFSASLETDMSPPDAEIRAGLPVYKPSSYDVLVKDAAKALSCALDENKVRLEIDFPPLPSSISGYKGSSDEFIDANIQLVLALIRKLYDLRRVSSRVVFPDKPEARRASRVFKPALELMNGVSFGSLDDIPGGAGSNFFKTLRNAFDFDFENNNEEEWKSDDKPELFFFVNCSTSELLAIEQYVDSFATEVPTVLFNLELDTLRSDLGLFGFPTKDVHYRFLSQFLPVFYIRTRDYSKATFASKRILGHLEFQMSITTAPFVLDYSGALLRIYPGPWEVMLKQGDGSYVCVAESPDRFTLGQTKQELLIALGLQEEEGSTMEFLRRGYKNSTWWEEDLELEESSAWRK